MKKLIAILLFTSFGIIATAKAQVKDMDNSFYKNITDPLSFAAGITKKLPH